MNTKVAAFTALLFTGATTVPGCNVDDLADDIATDQQALLTGTAFYDIGPGTQCSVGGVTMHCCPNVNGSRSVMIGLRLDQNKIKCQPLGDNGFADTTFLDTSRTQRNGMLACPLGSLMRGFHADKSLLLCIFPPHSIQSSLDFVDTGTQDGVGHVCGSNGTAFRYAMAGIRVDQNKFTCDTDGLL
jgi:hypothetical protein